MQDGPIDRGGTGRAIRLYGPEEVAAIRAAGRLAAATLDHLTPLVAPGVTTGELDRRNAAFIGSHGAAPAVLSYRGYPKSCCISVNHVVCHGIPSDDKRLGRGDTLNITSSVILDGWHGKTGRMFVVGGGSDAVPAKVRLLIERAHEALRAGIAAIRAGARLSDLGGAIEDVATASRNGVRFSVVRDFLGHGIGRELHEPPEVHHCRRKEGADRADIDKDAPSVLLEPGMIFTIQPMLNAGRAEVKTLQDGWTTVTRDRSASAQFEQMVAVTEAGCEVLTRSPAGFEKPPYG